MIGAALKDIVDSCVNIHTAAGKDDDVYANVFDILTCVMAITDNLQSSDRSDVAYEEAARLLDKIVAEREEE